VNELVQNLGALGTFVSASRSVADVPTMSDDAMKTFIAEKWCEVFEGKRGETARLIRNDKYWMGRHYNDAALNRAMPVTNYCFSTVETLHPVLTKSMPRPEPQPRDYRSKERIDAIATYAQWKMDQVGWERSFRHGVRDFLKHGWNWHLIGCDPTTGLSTPVYGSPYHLYPDPNARNEAEMEYFILAMPVATRRLRALFPKMADQIMPDNIASPEYQIEIFRAEMQDGYIVNPPVFASSALSFRREGTPTPTTNTFLVAGDGSRVQYGQTTFYVQLFVRDHSTRRVTYDGRRYVKHPEFGTLDVPHSVSREEPVSDSGWRLFGMCADGTLLQPGTSVEPCFGGIPIVMGRNYADGNWFYAYGEMDHIIPIQRDINKRDALIAQALEMSANPPIKAYKNSGLAANTRSVSGGEVLWLNQGHDISYMEFSGPSEKQFEYRTLRSRDIDTVSGVHDVQQGQRPAGIEAASAIRYLQEAAAARAVAKTPELLYTYTNLLKKCMIFDGYKGDPMVTIRASGGKDVSMSRSELLYDYDIRWAEGSGTEVARREQEDKVLQLFQLGLVDAQYAIGALDLKGKEDLIQRQNAREMMQMKMDFEVRMEQAKSGGAKPGGAANGNGNGNGKPKNRMQEAA